MNVKRSTSLLLTQLFAGIALYAGGGFIIGYALGQNVLSAGISALISLAIGACLSARASTDPLD